MTMVHCLHLDACVIWRFVGLHHLEAASTLPNPLGLPATPKHEMQAARISSP
jgi:hypothetical protein